MTTRNPVQHRVPTPHGFIAAQEHAGDGPAFVLLHGFPDDHRIYESLVPHLVAAGRRVVTFDFAGFGESERLAGASYSFVQQLQDLEAVVGALGLGRVIPVAHDAGGPAAVNFALKHPEQTASVVLLNCLYALGPNIRVPELITLFATPALNAMSRAALRDPTQIGWLLTFQQRMFREALPVHLQANFDATIASIIKDGFFGERSIASAFTDMTADLFPEVTRNTARLAELKASRVPFKLVWGQHDPYLGRGVADDILPHLAHATLQVLPGGHWLQLDLPEEVARAMLA